MLWIPATIHRVAMHSNAPLAALISASFWWCLSGAHWWLDPFLLGGGCQTCRCQCAHSRRRFWLNSWCTDNKDRPPRQWPRSGWLNYWPHSGTFAACQSPPGPPYAPEAGILRHHKGLDNVTVQNVSSEASERWALARSFAPWESSPFHGILPEMPLWSKW